jgi:uncharacterized radical SAM superfamily protein
MSPDATTRNAELEGEALLQEILAADPARWRCAWQVRREHHPPIIRFDRPSRTLPISLTGRACALQCAHCAGHYLEHMHPIWETQPNGASSLLISGGCDSQGRVPVDAHLESVARLRVGRRLNWHVGLVDDAYMLRIAPLVDVISFDVVGDRETAREVYGLDLDLVDYMRTFDLLRHYAPVVPHITVGLRAGKLSGELAALRALQQRMVDTLIFIVLIPTPGTAFAACRPPPLEQVADLFLQARAMLPSTRLYLGCMRPVGRYRQILDEIAVRVGLNAIVNPSRIAESVAAELGLEIAWGEECCALW